MADKLPLKAPIDRVTGPVSRFIHQEFTGGLVLFACVILAIVFVNTPAREAFDHFWEREILVGFNGYELRHSLHLWINDGLMAIFFFVIGLELKRIYGRRAVYF
jgi:Na+:H+ antiporter, NhaA family